jgi:hypothetical protein
MFSQTIDDLVSEIESVCYKSNDLRKKQYQNHPNKMRGHCYVASEALYHLLGGKKSGFVPHVLKIDENENHWFLKHVSGRMLLDPTRSQFQGLNMEYHKAVGKGFLTKKPSKRAKILISRIKNG